jgi:PAS domain S-box-containing protein
MGLKQWFNQWQRNGRARADSRNSETDLAVQDPEGTDCAQEHAPVDRELLASIVESADDAIVSKTLEGIVTSWNIGAERLFGYTAAEMLGKPITTIIPPELYEEERQNLARLRRGERIAQYETVRRRKDGSRVEVSLRISPMRDRQGRLTGASKVARNITRQKQAERALLQAQTELKQRKEHLEQEVAARTAALTDTVQHLEAFAYTVSHDLRAPLRAIKGLTLALREDYSHLYDEQGKDFADRIVEAVERMEQLIAALLSYSRIGKGEVPVVEINLEEYLPRLRTHWQAELEARGGQLDIAHPLPAVLANPTLLDQALTNLVSNALKFVAPGTVPQVRLNADTGDGMVRLRVIDNGIGIEPKHCGRLFQIFQRLHTTEKYPGLGIGLLIVRKAVERMGGRVGVDSEPGKGSCFWLELPQAT